jgi:hypothetical protein
MIYFAHSMRIYRTPEAKRCRIMIERYARRRNTKIFDPEDLNWDELVDKLGSHNAVYDYVIRESTEVVVREHQDCVGKGVHDEVLRALLASKPVWRLSEDLKRIHPVTQIQIVDARDWKIRYAELNYNETGIEI